MGCDYTYRGKKYSEDRLKRLLVEELPIRSQEESIKFLQDKLGMSRDEIVIVRGLIDQRSLGRFKSDGKVLLSDLATPDVAYHEAFHRVWRLYLSKTERLQAIKEVKNRKNIDNILKQYREIYPSLSDNDLIEEYLADEFSDFTINSEFKIELPIKSFFQRLINFIKRLLGLNPQSVQMIYDKILSKEYKSSSISDSPYLKDADKLIIKDQEFSVEQKNEIIQVITQRFIKAMFQLNGDVNSFLNGTSVKLTKVLDEYVIIDLLDELLLSDDNNPDYINAIYQDVEEWSNTGDSSKSVFINGVIQNLRLLGLNIKDVDAVDESEGSLDTETAKVREFQASVEFDPKSTMSLKVKLLLSSFTDGNTTPNFKLAQPLSWKRGFVQIATRMAGIPTQAFMDELANLNLPYTEELINILNKDGNFRNHFISSMALTENKFLIMHYRNDDIYFRDANSDTKTDNIKKEWLANLNRRMENWEDWINKVKEFSENLTKTSNQEILDHFGFKVNNEVENLRDDLSVLVTTTAKYKKGKPDPSKIFKQLGIEGYVSDLANKQSIYTDTVDLMTYLAGKKVYSLGLNSQQTTVINAIRYAQSFFTPEMSTKEKIEILRKYAPFQVSEFNVTELSNGEFVIHNKWLNRILNGERLNLVIPYIAKTQSGDQLEISKLDESDLMSMHINASLQGIAMSQKHADRSTFFGYTFGDKPLYGISKTNNIGSTLNLLVDEIVEQINLEAKLVRDMRELKLPVQYFGEKYEELAFASIIGKEDFEKVVNGDKVSNLAAIQDLVNKQFDNFLKDVEAYGLKETYTKTLKDDDGKNKKVTRYKGLNNSIVKEYTSADLALAAAFVNEVANHIQEVRFFSGDIRVFKNGNDLFKRLAPQSSTGKLSVTSDESNDFVRNQIDQEFTILNPKTGETVVVNPATKIGIGKDRFFRALTAEERSSFISHLNELAQSESGKPLISKLTGKQESKLFMMFEDSFMKDFPQLSLKEMQDTYLEKFELYEQKFKEINENDGISYMSLPAFKKFMLKQGNWSDGMEIVYQIEMQIAQLSNPRDIANISVEIDGVTFKPFEINPVELENGKKLDGFKQRLVNGKIVKLEAVHTLKTQFGGYSTPEEYFDKSGQELRYMFNSVFKTSQHLLLPSAIMGTNLQLMNFSMLTNGVDIIHMGSANKVGGVDAKMAAKKILANPNDARVNNKYIQDIADRGFDFYDNDGYFNHEAMTENLDLISYLADWDYLKDQVKIGNKVKDEIKGSTQSLKILLSNLIVNKQARFPEAHELVQAYKDTISQMVKDNQDSLLKRIGYDVDSSEFTNLDQLKKAVLESTQMKAAPENVRNAIENFFNDPSIGLEVTPMKNKIENVLYSLITNGIISFDRPGSTYPQAAVTGYEKLGSRKFTENEKGERIQTSNQDTLKFYNPVFDDEGSIIKMEPAEVIMPLPDYWIKPLLRWAKTNNLVKAIEMLNADIEKRPDLYQVKGLRIPNQQLSSNDIFQIKKFNLPTMQNYIIIPSEMVVKTGGDS